MRTEAKVGFKQHSTVWVWDSTWLPAVVVHRVQTGCLLVRLTHGVTFSVNVANLLPRDPLTEAVTCLGVARSFCNQRSGLKSKALGS
jgi:hypothetical protein